MKFSRTQAHAQPIGGSGLSSSEEIASRATLTGLGRGTVVWPGTARTGGDDAAGAQLAAPTKVIVDAMAAAGAVPSVVR
ncbi:hypothetical protein [Thauera aromatica]|uniref:Uncharacterized protein n=1 Tax=Thauera aromatica K172 TaxID=44139 RepID=A0A2R4BMN5_THAAR|nr:hypothetical protein [Thauera aromatica]AVR88453.1 hypothetical protein Tharo_1529 [Thauera aromatica K172]MCK2094469.1 hypothetical protein [Thauera aromatica]